MKIVFISNFLNDHQFQFCQNMFEKTQHNFCFIQTSKIPEDRKKLGWNLDYNDVEFLIDKNVVEDQIVTSIIEQADVFILGDTSMKIHSYKIKSSALILFYRERLFKKDIKISNSKKFYLYLKYTLGYHKYKSALLCASGYAPNDFSIIHLFKNKMYKWGYFPSFKKYDIDELMEIKNSNTIIKILWVGRLISWKRCEDVLAMANILKDNRIKFELKIVGGGELETKISDFIKKNHLLKFVKLEGASDQFKVRQYMEESNIFIITSNYEEGWGAVVNEAMNSGCAVIASHAAGSVPYLIKNYENGIIYECGNIEEMANLVLMCIQNKKLREKIGRNAYLTIKQSWNADNASNQLLKLIRRLMYESDEQISLHGPCSRADKLELKWYRTKGRD